jgi:hypothetical protein
VISEAFEMARELMVKSPDAGDVATEDEEHDLEHQASSAAGGSFRGAIDAFGSFYAAVTGLAIGGLETLADRRAEARAARLRQGGAPTRPNLESGLHRERPHRLRDRARRGALS